MCLPKHVQAQIRHKIVCISWYWSVNRWINAIRQNQLFENTYFRNQCYSKSKIWIKLSTYFFDNENIKFYKIHPFLLIFPFLIKNHSQDFTNFVFFFNGNHNFITNRDNFVSSIKSRNSPPSFLVYSLCLYIWLCLHVFVYLFQYVWA